MQVTLPEPHAIKIIPVPGERIKQPAHEITELTDQHNNKYIVHDYYVYPKESGISPAMVLLATGLHISNDDIWKIYKKSDKIVFFICELIK